MEKARCSFGYTDKALLGASFGIQCRLWNKSLKRRTNGLAKLRAEKMHSKLSKIVRMVSTLLRPFRLALVCFLLLQ